MNFRGRNGPNSFGILPATIYRQGETNDLKIRFSARQCPLRNKIYFLARGIWGVDSILSSLKPCLSVIDASTGQVNYRKSQWFATGSKKLRSFLALAVVLQIA